MRPIHAPKSVAAALPAAPAKLEEAQERVVEPGPELGPAAGA